MQSGKDTRIVTLDIHFKSLTDFAGGKYSFLLTACNFLWLPISRKEVSAKIKSLDFSKLWSDPLKFKSESAKRETRAFQIPSKNLYVRPLYFIDTEIYPQKYRELLLIPSIKAIRSANDFTFKMSFVQSATRTTKFH